MITFKSHIMFNEKHLFISGGSKQQLADQEYREDTPNQFVYQSYLSIKEYLHGYDIISISL